MKQTCLIRTVTYNEDIRNVHVEVATLIREGWKVVSFSTSSRAIIVLLEKE